MLPSKEIPFTIKATSIEVTENTSICYEELPYKWNNILVTKPGDHAGVYTAVSSDGCDSTTILNLSIKESPQQSTFKKTICSYQSYILPWDSTVTSAGTFTHYYKNISGCDSLIEQVILKDSACKQFLYIPTAFTPNTDNKNDIFKPVGEGNLVRYHFIIYNRWGKKVFDMKDFYKGWNGTINGFMQPAGTYIWFCEYELAGQPLHSEKGTVTLIR